MRNKNNPTETFGGSNDVEGEEEGEGSSKYLQSTRTLATNDIPIYMGT